MPHIIGRARNEAELYQRLREFITGVGLLGTVQADVGNTGNGQVLDFRVGGGYRHSSFSLVCTSSAQHGGQFSVTETDTRTGGVNTLPVAEVGKTYSHSVGGDRVVQFYLDFGPVDFEVGDTFFLGFVEKVWGSEDPAPNPLSPNITSVSAGTGSVSEQFTIECVTPSGQEPFTPAVFSVTGGVSGSYPDYVQGTTATYETLSFTVGVPHEDDEDDPEFAFELGDTFVVHTTENPLKALGQEWEAFKVIRRNPNTLTQFGQTGGPGLRQGDPLHEVFKGKGISGDKEIYVSVYRTWGLTSANWTLFGMRSWPAALEPDPALEVSNPSLYWQGMLAAFQAAPNLTEGQWLSSDYSNPVMQFWSGELPYWIVANGDSFAVAVINNQQSMQMYMGLYIPYDFPEMNPYPLFIGGSSSEAQPLWSSTAVANSQFWNHITSSNNTASQTLHAPAWVLEGLGGGRRLWARQVSEGEDSYTASFADASRDDHNMYPWGVSQLTEMRVGLSGRFPLFKARIGRLTGELHHLFGIPGLDEQSAENILFDAVANKKYVVLRNHGRVTAGQYIALELS